jgi:hypothetical protein
MERVYKLDEMESYGRKWRFGIEEISLYFGAYFGRNQRIWEKNYALLHAAPPCSVPFLFALCFMYL